jgi:hypothetical protein
MAVLSILDLVRVTEDTDARMALDNDSRICIRLRQFTAAHQGTQLVSFGLAELDPTPYVHSQSPSWWRSCG